MTVANVASLGARLANLELVPDGTTSLGVETTRGVIVVPRAAQALGMPAPQTWTTCYNMAAQAKSARCWTQSALDCGTADRARGASRSGGGSVRAAGHPAAKDCVRRFNYRKHAEETATPVPTVPPLFNKYNDSLNRHGGTITLPTRVAYQFDYETELVIVMGRECRYVTEDQALAYVAGYATGNDFSARDLQTATSQFMIGKTSDGFAPVGPWMVTADQVPDPKQPATADPCQRRTTAGLEHERHDLQLSAAHQLRVGNFPAQPTRHHLHRHPTRSHLRAETAAGRASLA